MQVKTITTENFVLTKMTAADGDKYFRLSNNENVMKFVTGHALDRQESDKMLAAFLAEHGSDSYLGRYLVEGHSGALVGVGKLDMDGNDVEIGYRIAEEHWGKGVATEIARALIRFAQRELHARQVIAYVNVTNAASIRVLEKAGMVNTERIEDPDEIKFKFIYSPQNSTPIRNVIDQILGLIRK